MLKGPAAPYYRKKTSRGELARGLTGVVQHFRKIRSNVYLEALLLCPSLQGINNSSSDDGDLSSESAVSDFVYLPAQRKR